MLNFTSLDQIFFVVAFFVPGFIYSACRSLFINRMERQGTEMFLRYLTFSTLNMVVFSWLVFDVLTRTQRDNAQPWLWFVILFVSPTVLGLLVGFIQRNDLISRILMQSGALAAGFQKIGLKLPHPIVSAWNWRLGSISECWAIVVLKDGTEWAGFFGTQSFASSDALQRDFYMQDVFSVDESDNWTSTGSSVWLSGAEIASIQFFPFVREEDREDGKQTDANE